MSDRDEKHNPHFIYKGDPATIIAVYQGDEEEVVLVRDEDGNNHVVPYVMFGELLDDVDPEVIFRRDQDAEESQNQIPRSPVEEDMEDLKRELKTALRGLFRPGPIAYIAFVWSFGLGMAVADPSFFTPENIYVLAIPAALGIVIMRIVEWSQNAE